MDTHEAWEKIHSSREWGGYPSEHVIRFIARNYYNKKRAEVKILDFGCGSGANTWFLAREGFDTYAFDISESAINNLNNRMEKEGLSVNSLVSDGLALPYEDEMFDAIYWAADKKITGMDTKFGTLNSMTRAQFVRFLYRYANMEGKYKIPANIKSKPRLRMFRRIIPIIMQSSGL